MKLGFSILLALFLVSCGYKNEYYTETIHQNWVFKKAADKRWLPAKVPGCVHTDLLDNKIIGDPFYRFREDSVKWIENEDWEYQTTFDVCECLMENSNFELLFDGLDTYADVYLNDTLVLKADNMFIAYRIPCKKLIKSGLNNLRVYFHSPVKIQEEKLKKYGYLPMSANEHMPENMRTRVFTRKAPFHYGWDWGPRLVTSGIWRPVRFAAWSIARIDDLYLKPGSVNKSKADYKAVVNIISDKSFSAEIILKVDGKEIVMPVDTLLKKGMNEITVPFTIIAPKLWWPNGWGGHKLYNVSVMLKKDRTVLDEAKRRLGVRTLELVQNKDSVGRSFYFKVNGVPIFMKGSNYIPNDIFTTRVTPDINKRLVNDAVSANMNMLRLWGGSVYEDDAFFDLLDENGILVWQDFMFACDMMPDESVLLNNIKKEAEYNVKRLRNHTCLALWCGNNENYRAWNDWNWKEKYSKKQAAELWDAYKKIFYGILSDAVKKYNPEVSYWESSPQAAADKNTDRKSGDEHDWSIWFGERPFADYGWEVPRFVSEYGVQSYPEMKTLMSFAGDTDLHYRSAVMEHRQRSNMEWIQKGLNGNGMILRYIEKYYKKPKDFFAYIYLSQVMHGEGMRYAIETHRKNMPRCMGSLYWQINDCWPTMSWASIDYFGRWKAPHYMIKKANEQVIIASEVDKNGTLTVHVVSEKLKTIQATLSLKIVDYFGKQKYLKTIPVKINPNTSTLCFEQKYFVKANNIYASYVVMIATLQNADSTITRNLSYLVPARLMPLHKPAITVKKIRKNDHYELELTSNRLARAVYIYTEKTDGSFSDNYFDIIPGEKIMIDFIPNDDTESVNFKTYSLADTY